MVQLLLVQKLRTGSRTIRCIAFSLTLLLLCSSAAWAANKENPAATGPVLQLEGGRRLQYEGSFTWARDVQGAKRSFWKKVLDVAVGAPEYQRMLRPYSIAEDSHGRLIITDPGAVGVHIYDFAKKRYKFIARWDKDKDPMLSPQCVAVDAQDNIYVTDSKAGKIFVFDPNGKFREAIGSIRGGEGYFKRPTGIAVDSAAQRIYVSDTLRNQVFILDMKGQVLDSIGKAGGDPERQFNLPTEVVLHGQELAVVDAMNFRIQFFDRDGSYRSSLGDIGDTLGHFYRPKGIGFDSEGHLYVVDASMNSVQVFTREGQLLFNIGGPGTGEGQFQLPAGITIDHQDRIFVVDSYNHRIQIFRYYGASQRSAGESR